jgi:hypothetical protein
MEAASKAASPAARMAVDAPETLAVAETARRCMSAPDVLFALSAGPSFGDLGLLIGLAATPVNAG